MIFLSFLFQVCTPRNHTYFEICCKYKSISESYIAHYVIRSIRTHVHEKFSWGIFSTVPMGFFVVYRGPTLNFTNFGRNAITYRFKSISTSNILTMRTWPDIHDVCHHMIINPNIIDPLVLSSTYPSVLTILTFSMPPSIFDIPPSIPPPTEESSPTQSSWVQLPCTQDQPDAGDI